MQKDHLAAVSILLSRENVFHGMQVQAAGSELPLKGVASLEVCRPWGHSITSMRVRIHFGCSFAGDTLMI